MILVRTPYRVSFFGGGTDLPGWTADHEGAVLSMAIDKYCWITLRKLPPYFPNHKHRIVYGKVEEVDRIEDIQHPAVRACLQNAFGSVEDGIEIHYTGDLPSRSGIGSSSAFTVGLLNGLHALGGLGNTEPEALARHAIRVEQLVLKSQLGAQDQIAAAYGGVNLIKFRPGLTSGVQNFDVQPVVADFAPIRKSLLFVYLGPRRPVESQAPSAYTPMRFRTLASMAFEGLRLITAGDVERFGRLLDEAWQVKKAFDNVSRSEIDERYAAARSAGAIGGKLCGAGGGGFMVLVVPTSDRIPGVLSAMGNPMMVPIKTDLDGSRIVHYRPEVV